MTLSGPEALRSLEEALRDVRREEDDIAKRLARGTELVGKFRESESELLKQLAAVRLEHGAGAELAGRLNQAEARARDMLGRHAEDLAKAEAELAALDAAVGRLNAERVEQAAAVAAAQKALQALADRAAADSVGNPAYAAQRKTAEDLAAVAAESLEKTEQAEADREQKGRPYRDDPLFMYLWERGWGTKNYRENNLVRYLDSLVAGLVRFPEARVNFAMLNEIPLRLREHAERQQQIAAAAVEDLAALERAAVDAAGGRPTREALERATARMAAIDAEIVGLEDERDEAAARQRELAQGADPAFAGAVSALAEALGREDIASLVAAARATETGADDTIVKQIDELRERIVEEETDSREQRARLKTLAGRRRELEDIQYEFKKSGFDNPRSSFGQDDLVGNMLNDFLRGGISAADYWSHWRKSQRFAPRDDDDDDDDDDDRRRSSPWRPSGGFNWPDSSFAGGSSGGRSSGGFGGSWGRLPGVGGSSGGSGGFSRPRTGSKGTRTHGGFKTGGGF